MAELAKSLVPAEGADPRFECIRRVINDVIIVLNELASAADEDDFSCVITQRIAVDCANRLDRLLMPLGGRASAGTSDDLERWAIEGRPVERAAP